MQNEVWILGATGRSGRDVAARLDAAGVELVLVGRSAERLDQAAAGLTGAHRVIVGSLDWLRVGDAGEFTAEVLAEVTRRLLDGQGRPGAHTPGALFGPELAENLGGEFSVVDGRVGR